MSDQNPLSRLAEHVVRTGYDDLTPRALRQSKTFLIDTFGVGVAGRNGAGIDRLIATAKLWGEADEATVWVHGTRLPASSAAIVNAYQIHSLEFDCVHEGAVMHPMATILSAVFAYAERRAKRGKPVSGRDFLTACILGIDVSAFLGVSARGPIRFFRPATAGGFGAAAALGKLEGFDADTLVATLGNQYGQASGTLQAHVEGSPLLGLQVGFNARAAITSCDLAAGGFFGPRDSLTGMYGYFRLYENNLFDVEPSLAELGSVFQIERVSHKPFPSGRLTHGVVDGLGRLMGKHGFGPDDVAAITCTVPELVNRLVGRPDIPNPAPNYAKLCIPFVAGTFLNHGVVDVPQFLGPDMLENPRTHAFASKVKVIQDQNPDPNTMVPQTIRVDLASGATHEIVLHSVFGHPDAPLTDAQNLDKFWRCWANAKGPSREAGKNLIAAIEDIAAVKDVSELVRFTLA